MLLVDSIFSDYTATCLSVYQPHSKYLSFHEVSYIVQNQYTVRVLCYLTGDTSLASPLGSLTSYGNKNSPCPRAGFRRSLRSQVPCHGGLWHFFGSISLHLVFWISAPGPFGLQPPGASNIPWLSKLGQTAATAAAQWASASSQLSIISVKIFTACAILNSS